MIKNLTVCAIVSLWAPAALGCKHLDNYINDMTALYRSIFMDKE